MEYRINVTDSDLVEFVMELVEMIDYDIYKEWMIMLEEEDCDNFGPLVAHLLQFFFKATV